MGNLQLSWKAVSRRYACTNIFFHDTANQDMIIENYLAYKLGKTNARLLLLVNPLELPLASPFSTSLTIPLTWAWDSWALDTEGPFECHCRCRRCLMTGRAVPK